MNQQIKSHTFYFILKNGQQLTSNVELLSHFSNTEIFEIAMKHFSNRCWNPLELKEFTYIDNGIVDRQ